MSGPDGLLMNLTKYLRKKIIPILHKLSQKIENEGIHPPCEANIILIAKPTLQTISLN